MLRRTPFTVACAVAAGVAFAAAVVAGCGSTSRPTTTHQDGRPVALSDPRVMDLLTRSGSYEENEYRLRIAENRLAGACMKAKGFDYPSDVAGPAPSGESEHALRMKERRRDGYGLFQAYSAQQSGADAGTSQDLPAAEQRVRQLPNDKQAAYDQALMGAETTRQAIQLPGGGEVGFPATGCIAEARARLYGDLLVWARVAHVPATIEGRLSRRVGTDPAYVEAEEAWRACMKRKGYAYQKPGDGYPDLQRRYENEGPSQRLRRQEITIAVADAECAHQASIPSAVRAAKQHGVEELPPVEQAALRELTGEWLGAVATARQIAERRAGEPPAS